MLWVVCRQTKDLRNKCLFLSIRNTNTQSFTFPPSIRTHHRVIKQTHMKKMDIFFIFFISIVYLIDDVLEIVPVNQLEVDKARKRRYVYVILINFLQKFVNYLQLQRTFVALFI